MILGSYETALEFQFCLIKNIEPYTSDCIGKPDELLENPAEDNQQPSLELTIKKGSETNSII